MNSLLTRDCAPSSQPNRNVLATHASPCLAPPTLERISVEHTPEINDRLLTTVEYRRLDHSINASADEAHNTLVKTMLLDLARELPELKAFHAVRARDKGIGTEQSQIALELYQNELDRRKAIADPNVNGLKLAETLSALDTQKRAIEAKLDIFERGRDLFAGEVNQARTLAEASLRALLKAQVPAIHEAAKQRHEAVREKLKAWEPLWALLDEAAAAKRLFDLTDKSFTGAQVAGMHGITTEYQRRLMAILDQPAQPPIPKPDDVKPAAQAEPNPPSKGKAKGKAIIDVAGPPPGSV